MHWHHINILPFKRVSPNVYINPCEDVIDKYDKTVKKIRAGKIAKVVLTETMTRDFQDLVFPLCVHDNSRKYLQLNVQ
jgi:hypothetical protein